MVRLESVLTFPSSDTHIASILVLRNDVLTADSGTHVIGMYRKGFEMPLLVAGKGNTSGRQNGSRKKATFNCPRCLALWGDEAVLVADSGNSCIRIIGNGLKSVDTVVHRDNFFKKHDVYNICSSNSVDINKLAKYIYKKVDIEPKIINKNRNNIEVLKTHGDNKKILKFLNTKISKDIYLDLPEIIDWYKHNKIWKLNE